jgi:Asp-tRNA(Asn)/Glu-tRNA(Gln) amidotransferase A subunit family amidase
MSDTIANPPGERELRSATLCQTLHWLAAGRVTAERLTHSYLDAIARSNPRLNACQTPHPEHADVALEQARASDRRRRAGGPIGRLDGVPVTIKDNIDVAGLPTTCGLPGRNASAARDAHVVERLRGAGTVILAKTGLDEGVLGASGKNPHFGNVHNPWRQGLSPGGSSAGAAAAVAAGLCAAAIGSDSLGSIRIPASYCGVNALKPTPGEISARGLWPAARRLDCIGLIARSVDDLGVLLHVLADYDAQDPRSCRRRVELALPDWEPDKLRVGVFADLAAFGTDAAVAALFVRAMQTLGHELQNCRIVDFADFSIPLARRAAFFLIEAEMLVTYADALVDAAHPVSPQLAGLLAYARSKSAADYVTADRVLDAAVLKARRLFAQVDVLVTPTTPQAAFAHAAPVPANQADFTCFANLAGCPALSLPMGITADGLPVGLQFIGPPGSDLRLLELAEVCAAALDATPAYPIGE